MLHHYNYSTSLSQFLSYHQLEDQTVNDNDHNRSATTSLCESFNAQLESHCKNSSSASNKSFTIAAILGLKSDNNKESMNAPTDLRVVNLSVHQTEVDRSLVSSCNRLQLPVRHVTSSSMATPGQFSLGCHPNRNSGKKIAKIYFHLIYFLSVVRKNLSTININCVVKFALTVVTVRGLKHITSNVMQNKKNCKSKRVRTIFTPEQLERLEAEFERQQYMVGPERLYLAHTLQLTEAQVNLILTKETNFKVPKTRSPFECDST